MLPSSHSTVFVSICLSVTKLPWLIMCTKASPPQKVPSVKWAELNLAHTILTIHHSCLLEQSRKRGNSESEREEEEGKRKSHFCATCEPLIRIHCYSLWQWRWWCFFIVVKDTFVSKGIKERPSHQFAMLAFCLRWRITIQVPSK